LQLLRRMQTLLAQLYDAPVREDVQDFVLSDRQRLSEMVGEQADEARDEQVFVVEEAQGMRLGLFIDQDVLARLARRDPLEALDEDNLPDYCTALEGVSHFHYLVWSVARGRNVSSGTPWQAARTRADSRMDRPRWCMRELLGEQESEKSEG